MGFQGDALRTPARFYSTKETLPLAALCSPQPRGASGFCWDLGGREDVDKERKESAVTTGRQKKSRNDGGVVWTGMKSHHEQKASRKERVSPCNCYLRV